MANVYLEEEYYYIDGVQQSSPSYGWAGYNTSNKKYYVSVAKYYTDSYICAPKFALYTGGTDNTNSSKQLGVYFVACSSSSTPSNTIITTPSQIANNHQTRIRFGYTYYSNGTYSSYNNTSWGYGETSSSLVLAPGYFFVYVGTAQASSHTYSSHYTINSKYYPAQLTYSTPSTYTVKYDANGGTGAPSSQTKIANVTLTLSSTKPTRAQTTATVPGSFVITGDANGGYFGTDTTKTTTTITATTSRTDTTTYSFTKWNTKTDGSGDAYSAGGSYTANSGTTLYAQWNSSVNTGTTSYSNNKISALTQPTKADTISATYTVTFDANGGSVSTSSAKAETKREYTFKGWATSKTATSANASASYTSKTTVYAYWTTEDHPGSVSLPTPNRVGYKFVGWATSQTATSANIGTGTYTPTKTITIYAVWEPDGSIRLYVNSTDKYKLALVYVYAPTSTSDTKPWKLAIPYLYTSGTQPWKIIAG